MANKLSKPVIQCTLEGVEIREFNTITEVKRLLGYKQTAIYGFRWQFK